MTEPSRPPRRTRGPGRVASRVREILRLNLAPERIADLEARLAGQPSPLRAQAARWPWSPTFGAVGPLLDRWDAEDHGDLDRAAAELDALRVAWQPDADKIGPSRAERGMGARRRPADQERALWCNPWIGPWWESVGAFLARGGRLTPARLRDLGERWPGVEPSSWALATGPRLRAKVGRLPDPALARAVKRGLPGAVQAGGSQRLAAILAGAWAPILAAVQRGRPPKIDRPRGREKERHWQIRKAARRLLALGPTRPTWPRWLLA